MIRRKDFLGGFLVFGIILSMAGIQAEAGCRPEEEETIIEVVDNREYADLVIAQVPNTYVNVRDLPDAGKGKVLGKLYNNSVGHFIEEENGWYKITSGTVTGYVSGEYCVQGLEALRIAKEVEITYAKVNVSNLRVRKKPNTTSTILGTFSKGDELVVTDIVDNWAKITYNNETGYISLDYADIRTDFVEAESIEEERARLEAERKAKEEARRKAEAAIAAEKAKAAAAAAAAEAQTQQAAAAVNTDASLGQQVVDYAVQFVGNPYVYGGISLTSGCDCSGFVYAIYKHFGLTLKRTGLKQEGYAIGSLSEAQPGDLLFYSGHVAIYMGNNQIVHAATKKKGICIGDANYAKIVAIRRIF